MPEPHRQTHPQEREAREENQGQGVVPVRPLVQRRDGVRLQGVGERLAPRQDPKADPTVALDGVQDGDAGAEDPGEQGVGYAHQEQREAGVGGPH